jgi:hypothetical protein
MSMVDLTKLSDDDDLRTALFDALVERLEAEARKDPSIALVNRMTAVLVVSRLGNLLTLSQGLGLWLLRGDLKSKDRRERLKTFNVGRSAIRSGLAIMPDGFEGAPDEILDRIVTMFLEWTAAGEETPLPPPPARPSAPPPPLRDTQPAPRSARQESRPAARVPQKRPTPGEPVQQPRATSDGSTQERRPATPRTIRETVRAPVVVSRAAGARVNEEGPPTRQMAEKPTSAEAALPPPAPIREITTPTLRTYQLLFETARRELGLAKSLPTRNNMSFLLSAGVFVAFTAEAFFNDLGSRVIPFWSQLQRLDPREKAEVLNIELFNEKLDWSVRPFQSVATALGFRRALAHAHAETLSFDQMQTAGREASEVPRTRRAAWQEHCDVATIQRWITDVHSLIEHFSSGHDPTEVAVGSLKTPISNE